MEGGRQEAERKDKAQSQTHTEPPSSLPNASEEEAKEQGSTGSHCYKAGVRETICGSPWIDSWHCQPNRRWGERKGSIKDAVRRYPVGAVLLVCGALRNVLGSALTRDLICFVIKHIS